MPGPIQSIQRAAGVLELIAESPRPLRLAEISAAVQLAKGTVHGILHTLVDVGFVSQDRVTGRYRIGAGLLELGSGTIDRNEMRARSMNWADPLASRTGEAVRVGMLSVTDVLIVHYVFRPDESHQTSDVGALLPAHATAMGKAMLAYSPGARTRMPLRLPAFTPRTMTTWTQLDAELARIRKQGHAVDFEELSPNLASIAAPIFGHGGLVVAAVAIHGHVDRLFHGAGVPSPKLLAAVIECSHAITRELEIARTAR